MSRLHEISSQRERFLHSRDHLLVFLLRSATAIGAGVVLLIGTYVTIGAWPAMEEMALTRFVSDQRWSPLSDQFNMMPMIVGTLAATFGSVLLTAPLGIGSAVFLRFYAPAPVAAVYRRVIEILAGVPSVVYGLWGLTALAPLIASISPLGQGQSLLAGVLVLSLMTLPTVAMAADAALGSTPISYHQGAAALGLGRRAIAWSIVVPAARGGIASGVLLQTARALGETMAVLMVCGNIVQTPDSFLAPIRTLTANIALEMGYADDRHRSVLFVSGLLLLIIVMVIVLAASRFDRKRKSFG